MRKPIREWKIIHNVEMKCRKAIANRKSSVIESNDNESNENKKM